MGLLQAIFGGGHSTPQTPPPPGHQWGYDEQGNLVPVPVAPQAPTQAPQGAPSPLSAAPAPQAPQQAPAASPDATDGSATPVQVVGRVPQDNWQPHHAGILGQISDYILGTHFGRENERRNLAGALQSLETNPNLAIRRLMKVNPELAMRLEGQEADDKRQAGVAARQEDYDNYRKEQATYQLASQMLASAKDPTTYTTLREQVRNLYNSRSIPFNEALFPEQYDETAVHGITDSTIKNGQKAQIAETGRHHGVTEQQGEERIDETGRHNLANEGLGAARVSVSRQQAAIAGGNLSERVRHDGVSEGQRQQTINSKPPGVQYLDTKYGKGRIDKTGKVMIIEPNDPRIDQSKLTKNPKDGKSYLVYHNYGTVDKPFWRLSK
jgi:hypothetical protein